MTNQAKLLLNKFLSFSVGSWISLFISLLSTPIITRLLTPEEFGIYSLFTVVLNLFLLVSLFGLDQSYVRYYYELTDNGKIYLLKKCLLFAVIVSLFFSVILTITEKWSINIIFGTDDITLLIYFIIGIFISVINRYAILLVRMEQQAKLFSLLQIIQKVCDFFLFLLLFFLFTFKINHQSIPIISYLFALVCVTIIGISKNYSVWKKALIKQESTVEVNLTDLIKYGAPLGITLLLTWAFQYIDRIMLKQFSGYDELGIYSAAFKLISILNIIQTSFSNFWVPISNQRFAENPMDKQFFSRMFKVVFVVMICLGFTTILFRNLFKIFFGPGFENAIELLPMLIFIPIMYTLSEITVVGINFMKKPKFHIIISIAVCVINIIGNFVLIPHLGAKGAAVSTGISYVIFFLLRTYFGQKLYKFQTGVLYYFILFIFLFYAIFSTV